MPLKILTPLKRDGFLPIWNDIADYQVAYDCATPEDAVKFLEAMHRSIDRADVHCRVEPSGLLSLMVNGQVADTFLIHQ